MQHTVHLDHLEPPWVADEAWQQTADAVFKGLAVNGGLVLQLQAGSKHLDALLTAFACIKDVLYDQRPCGKRVNAPGGAAAVGLTDLGHERVFGYLSGPWPTGTLGTQQHAILQKAMSAGQNVCRAVLRCVAASRGVRLAPGSLIGLAESPPLDPQQWSASSLHAVRSTPVEAAAEGSGYTAEPLNGGLMTLVYAPGQANLQVRDAYGEWQEVGRLGENQVLVMPGHALEYALCGLLPAAKHRMLAPGPGEPTRFSLSFELSPAVSADIDLREALDAAGHAIMARRYRPRTGQDLMSWFRRTYFFHKHSMEVGVWCASSPAASCLAGSPGTADDAGLPGKRQTSTVPSGGQEAVWSDEMIKLDFSTLYGRIHRLAVSRFSTLSSILLQYQEKEGVPPEMVHLIFAGRKLEQDRTPADYRLKSGDVLHAIVPLRGD